MKMDEIFKKAAKAFHKHDKLKAEIRKIEQELTNLCREYDMASGCRGVRIESLRQRAQERLGRRAA